MKSFLLNYNNYSISLFSLYHILLMSLTFLILLIVIINKKKIKNFKPKTKKIIKYTFGVILIINLIIRRGSFIYFNVYDWQKHLDINFCNFVNLLTIIYIFSGNKKVLEKTYYMSFVGPLLAVILPSYNLQPLTYSFISFILTHHILLIFNFIFIFMDDLRYDKYRINRVLRFLIIYFVIIYTFDYSFNVNYNMPLTFINTTLLNNPLIKIIASNVILTYIAYVLVINLLLIIGDFTLKYITKQELN